jgi:hypothetical protein
MPEELRADERDQVADRRDRSDQPRSRQCVQSAMASPASRRWASRSTPTSTRR